MLAFVRVKPRLRAAIFIVASWWCLAGSASALAPAAQAPPQAPPPAQAQPPARPRPAATSATVFIHVRNPDGRPLSGVHLALSGAATREQTTDFEGVIRLQSTADGAYHLKFDREGFISFEQDLTLKRGQPDLIDVTLVAAPPPEPPPPPPLPPPPPPPATPPASPAASVPPSDGEQKIMSIPDFVNKNFIGKENLKESTLGCTGTSTTRLLQVRSVIQGHVHANVDEVLYVVAGEGTFVMSEGNSLSVGPGSLAIVPRGAMHAIERRGKNPLILLSTLTGAACGADAQK